ncbi:DUF58 domain-containing protein [soil metagenome]
MKPGSQYAVRGTQSRATTFLPPGLLERLGGLDVIARAVVQGFVAGIHRSPLRGAGEEFARHREYQQGDDVRRLDWKLYGRTDRLYIREFEERSNLAAYLVVDASASMAYAEPDGVSKLLYAKYLAAALAHLMLRAGDAVGLASFGADARLLVRPRSTRGQLHQVLHQLQRLEAQGDGSSSGALQRAGEGLRRRGRVVLISDMLEEHGGEAIIEAVGRLRARGDEVICLRVMTPSEAGTRALPAGRFFDPERPGTRLPAAPGADPGYAERVATYYRELAARLRERGAEYVPILTDDPVERSLIRWLRAREA